MPAFLDSYHGGRAGPVNLGTIYWGQNLDVLRIYGGDMEIHICISRDIEGHMRIHSGYMFIEYEDT